jgi:4-amino-4-deoxy-L-arabinose transferase-like glycosyltransferase
LSHSKPPARWIPWALAALALGVRLLTAWPLQQPGYTDAYYYAVGAQQLDAGRGFEEPFIWNYLDPPESVPHPGYLYWMPLTAILGWLGLAVVGVSFGALQLPFVLVSALLPLMAYAIAWDLTREQKHAVLSGLLAVFPGFYTHVLVLPDNFAPFALAGCVSLWAAGRGLRDRKLLWFGLAGLAAGLGHLARADGLLLLGVALAAALALVLPQIRSGRGRPAPWWFGVASAALVFAGYLIAMGPWFLRNWSVFGTPLPGAGMKTMFLTTYDDMFAYGRPLTLQGYLAWGWGEILTSKTQALWLNLQRLWVENLLIFLLPFSTLGLWNLRRERLLWPFFLYLPLLFLSMTLVFTFPGVRGGLFHSGGALLPFFFATAGPGLEAVLRWAARRFRGWHVKRAWRVFSAGLVGLAVLVTALALWRAGVYTDAWNERDLGYSEIADWLTGQDAGQAIVMVGNAPGFTWHSGHMAIAIPNEPLETIVDVAGRYGARYLVLDAARPRTTDRLYEGEEAHPELLLRYTVEGRDGPLQVYEILGRQQSIAGLIAHEGVWTSFDVRQRVHVLPAWKE